MTLSALEIVLTLIVGAVGVGSGFWLRGWAWATPDAAGDDEAGSPASDEEESQEQRRAKEALSQLHDLAERVAADVGAHSDRVQEINQELTGGEQTNDAVLAAMEDLIQANERMQAKLDSAENRLQEQAKQMETIEEQALTDALTGIANRRAFDDFTSRQHKEFLRHGRPVTVLMLDVDYFKKFNDTYGHAAGDEVLKGVANVIKDKMREIDLVARYGGEEFSVVFPGSHVRECGPAAQRARQAIENAVFHHEGTDLKVTASFGLAELRSGETIGQTIKRADEALYAAKKAGRNNTHWHDGESSHPVEDAAAKPKQPEIKAAQMQAKPTPAPTRPEAPAPAPKTDLGIDEETRLSNRQSFTDDVRRRLAEWKRAGSPLSLIVVGIDDLPGVVEQFGDTGRHVAIKAATQFLKAAMRDMDHVARLEEGKFSLMLPGANLTSAEMIAERLRHAIAKCALPLAGEQLRFTISLGVAEARHGDDADSFLVRTEKALDEAQTGDANRTLVHNGKSCQPAKETEAVEA